MSDDQPMRPEGQAVPINPDPEENYANVRRYIAYLEQSLIAGTGL
jgi:hypothetical protein